MTKRQKKQPTPGDVMVVIGIAALMGLAIREQLQMPPEVRTWRGTLFGIPYDFRRPTIEHLRETFWNKDTGVCWFRSSSAWAGRSTSTH